MTKESLLKESRIKNYKPENLEKVKKLLFILEQFMSLEYLRSRLVLKGGTALNLFHFDPVPRLSVDIDFNYIGDEDPEVMKTERPIIEDAISKILIQNKFEEDRKPNSYAGGKSIWKYDSVLGQKGNLEIDLNYMYRLPLWPISYISPLINTETSFSVPVLDIHELAAGKLTALFARNASRDLFDAHYLLKNCKLNEEQLRTSFVIYISMSSIPLINLSPTQVIMDTRDIRNKLLPVLSQTDIPRKQKEIELWAQNLLIELQSRLKLFLPLNANEITFINKIREEGVIEPKLITTEEYLSKIILAHPLIRRKISKVAI